MTDDELINGFESGTLASSAFGHREHVRVAWLYLARHGRVEAERKMLDGLRAFATRVGKPDKFDGPLTIAWVAAIATAAADTEPRTFEDLIRARPDLLRAVLPPDPTAARPAETGAREHGSPTL